MKIEVNSIVRYEKIQSLIYVIIIISDPNLQIQISIPGSLYLLSSIALVLITKYYQNST